NRWAEAPPLREAAASWERRLERLGELEHLLRSPRGESAAVDRAWKALQEAGGHPDADAHAQQAAQAADRAAALDALRRVPRELSEKADDYFAAAWDDDLLRGWWEGE